MFHLFTGKIKTHGDETYIKNDLCGVLVTYVGKQKSGTRFLHPVIDPNRNTILYYAFDSADQKQQFFGFQKIQGIGAKYAYQLCMTDAKEISSAIESFDIKYFTNIPGIGPKTAKRIIVEMKTQLDQGDLMKLNIDHKLLKNILSSLHDLGYERKAIKKLLPDCPFELKKSELPDILKWLVENL